MKFKSIINRLSLALAGSMMLAATSCNYLDVVPVEQVQVDDAMENYSNALGFLYSCYAFSNNDNYGELPYGNYLSDINTTADDVLNPHAWASDGNAAVALILLNTLSSQNAQDYWSHNYNGVGQCLLFLEKLDECRVVERGIVTLEEEKEWRAEAKALMAYYHFVNMRRYGPVAILEERLPLTASQASFPGRSHFDYCVDWVVKKLDEAAEDLPAKRTFAYTGRMTSTICKALKAKVLLLAASPLWNGKFPYPDFKNTNYETEGYGYELVSHTYSEEKWTKALAATTEAIQWAETKGERALYYGDGYSDSGLNLDNLYIPGGVDNDFKMHVMRMRNLHYAPEADGNREFIMTTTPGGLLTQCFASMPHNIMTLNSGTVLSGWSGFNPTLNAVKNFLTDDGYTIDTDPNYYPESEWYESAGLWNDGNDRGRIIKLHTKREPRFYAWIGYDGGDYTMWLADGNPVTLNMLSPNAQGFSTATRDNSISGYLNMKYLSPTMQIAKTNYYVGWANPTRAIIRLAELYLNRAECYAQLGRTAEAIADVNKIRERAGAGLLEQGMVNGKMTIMDWVRQERAIEFFAEGQRYFDVRRWCEGEKYLGLGKRMGLNSLAKENPSVEEFNQPVRLPYTYTWGNKLYLYPIIYTDVYANPQLVQNPGY